MIRTRIIDANGTGYGLHISRENAAAVVVHPHPPEAEMIHSLPYRAYFTNPAGSNDMAVDGSSTNVSFKVGASDKFDIFVKSISVDIGDGGSPNLNLFGAIAALTNGVEWIYSTITHGEYQLHDGIKTNREFIRVGQATGAIGTGADAYLADVSGGAGSEKSYLPVIDISDTFGMPYGMPLRRGSTDSIIFKVKDNLAALTTLNIIAYGQRLNELEG
jgi:hypothetical protein